MKFKERRIAAKIALPPQKQRQEEKLPESVHVSIQDVRRVTERNPSLLVILFQHLEDVGFRAA